MSDSAPRPDRTWLYVAVGFVVFWGAYLAFFGPGRLGDSPSLEGTGLATPAEYGWALRDLDGKPVGFDTFKGKPVFLNIWATWCGPCVRELPSIARMAATPEADGVSVVCVATDDSPGTVKDFVASRGKAWPKTMTVLHASDVPPVFATEGIPATFMIDANGRVAASQIGSTEWDKPDVLAFLKKLKGGEAGAETKP